MPASQRRKKKNKKKQENEPKMKGTPKGGHTVHRLSFAIGVFLVCYLVLFLFQRTKDEGFSESLYDILYLTNFALLLGAIGMIIQSVLFIGVSLVLASFVHAAWTYDLINWCLFDSFPNGRTAYFEDFNLHTGMWWTTLHQFWYIPLSLVVLYCEYRHERPTVLPNRAWAFAAGNYTRQHANYLVLYAGSGSSGLAMGLTLAGAALGHELWKESSPFIHRYDNSSLLWFLIWRWIAESVVLNGVGFLFLKAVCFVLVDPGSDSVKIKEKIG